MWAGNGHGGAGRQCGQAAAQLLIFAKQAALVVQGHLQALLELALEDGGQLLKQLVQGVQLLPGGLEFAVQV
jgi:hypothetical protein